MLSGPTDEIARLAVPLDWLPAHRLPAAHLSAGIRQAFGDPCSNGNTIETIREDRRDGSIPFLRQTDKGWVASTPKKLRRQSRPHG